MKEVLAFEVNEEAASLSFSPRTVERCRLQFLNFGDINPEAIGRPLNSSRIFIVMLHLYGTREDTKIWAKIISAHAKKSSRMEVSVAEGRWVGQKRGLCSDLSRHERITGRLQVWRSNKYSAQYPLVLRWSLERSNDGNGNVAKQKI